MSANVSKSADLPRRDGAISRRLFFLDLAAGRVLSVILGYVELPVGHAEGSEPQENT